jgi:hypothetical protein
MAATADDVIRAIRDQFIRGFCTPEVIAKRLRQPN